MEHEKEQMLVQRAANGDRGAFERLFEGERLEALYAYIRARVRDSEQAKDVLSETMLAIWQGLNAFSGQSLFTTWCIGIARRKLADSFRRSYAGKEQPLEVAEKMVSDENGYERVEAKLTARKLMKALSSEERELVELVFSARMSYQQAADELGIPVGTVKSRMSAIRAKLRKAGGMNI